MTAGRRLHLVDVENLVGAVRRLRGLGMSVNIVASPTAVARRLRFAAGWALLPFPQLDRGQAMRDPGDLVVAA